MELNKKAAYLQGLVDGLGVDESTKEGKIIKAMAALLGEMADAIAAMDEDLTRAYDQINDLSEELEDLEADLYEDEDAEDEVMSFVRRIKVQRLRSKTVTPGGVELTVEVQLRERFDIVNKLLDTEGVHSATLIACQSEAGN